MDRASRRADFLLGYRILMPTLSEIGRGLRGAWLSLYQWIAKMNYLHYPLNIGDGEAVEVTLDKQANVKLLDELNFSSYKRGQRHNYYGGLVKQSPTRLSPPRTGFWHLVIDLGGYTGSVRASVRTIHGAA